METSKYVLDAVMAVATGFAKKGVDITLDKAKGIIEEICKKNPILKGQIDISEMAGKIKSSTGQVGRVAYNEETLARFMEIPVSDLATVNAEDMDLGMIYEHVKLEGEFQEWLQEWGYEVKLGCPLIGLKKVEYIPDVHGILNTLHGEFETCINFVCDSPPDEDRIFALLSKIEAYAEAKKSFSYSDFFAIVTPHRFTQAAMNAMALQNEQENYSVIAIDGGDIFGLENSKTPKERLEEFQNKVRQAEEESKMSKIKRQAQNPQENRPE